MSPLRTVSLLILAAGCGAAGWYGGRAAHSGLLPASPSGARTTTVHTAPARVPRVEPASPAGNWMARARTATSSDFPALLAELNTLFPGDPLNESGLAAMEWLLALWITRDADAAAAWVVEKNNGRLAEFGALMASVAPDKIAAMLQGPHGKALGPKFADAALRALAESDPREFLKLDPQAAGDAFTSHYARAMRALAQTDPAAASELWLRRGVQAPGGKDALYNVVGNWIAHDPQAARRWVETLPAGEARHLAQHAGLGSLAKRDPAAARRALADMDLGDWLPGAPGGMDQPELQYPQDARMILLAALARQDFAGAVEELNDMVSALPPELSGGHLDMAAKLRRALAEAVTDSLPADPAAFFTALTKLTRPDGEPLDGQLRLDLEQRALEQRRNAWDGPTSLEALRLLNSGAVPREARAAANRSQLEVFLLQKAMQSDADGCLSMIAALPDAARGPLAQRAMNNLYEGEIAARHRTAAMIPAEHWNASLGSRLAQSPEEFAPILSQLPHRESTAEARAAFTKLWADKNPDAAAQWIAALPNGATSAARGLAEGWAAYDDTAASTWAASLPPGEARDGAAVGLATTIAATEPEAAWQWAASISDPALSVGTFEFVARQLGGEATPAFRAAFSTALDRAALPAEYKAAALRVFDLPPGATQPSPP